MMKIHSITLWIEAVTAVVLVFVQPIIIVSVGDVSVLPAGVKTLILLVFFAPLMMLIFVALTALMMDCDHDNLNYQRMGRRNIVITVIAELGLVVFWITQFTRLHEQILLLQEL